MMAVHLLKRYHPLIQAATALLLAAIVGMLLAKGFFVLLIALIAAVVSVLVSYKYMRPFPAFVVKLFIATAFIETAFFSINVGPFSLFPYRMLLVVVLLMLFLHVTLKHSAVFQWSEIQVKEMVAFLAFWIVYALVSLIWVRSLTAGVKELIYLTSGVAVIFAVVFYFKRMKDYVHFYYIWMAMLVFLCAIGVWETVTGEHLSTSRILAEPGWDTHIPTGVFFNQNDYATYLAVSVFFVVALIKYGHNLFLKLAGSLLLPVTIYLIVATESRANLLAVALGFFFSFLFLTKPFHRFVLVFFGSLALVVGGYVFFEEIQLAIQSVLADFAFLTGDFEEGRSEDIRINLIQNALVFLFYSIGFGVGSGNAEFFMQYHFLFPTQGVVNVHNWWVEIMVDYGIIPFVGYVVLYLSLIILLYRHYKQAKDKHDKMISEALVAALVAFSLASLSPSSMMILTYQWVLFAFAIGYLNMVRYRKRRNEA